MNWEALWGSVAAVATAALALTTIGLVWVGYRTAEWAKRTFGQTEHMEAQRQKPHVSLWPLTMTYGPLGPTGFQQVEISLKWAGIIESRNLRGIVTPTRLACAAYNLGPGPAVRVTIPYTLTVFDVIEDNSETFSAAVDGTFEIVHVPPFGWNHSLSYIDVTYFPKYKIDLHLNQVLVEDFTAQPLENVVANTSRAVLEYKNSDLWALAYQLLQSQTPGSSHT